MIGDFFFPVIYRYFVSLKKHTKKQGLSALMVLFSLEGMKHSTHFIYGYMASDIWLRTIQIAREETRCRHMGNSFQLAARIILYASSHRQDNTNQGLCYTSRGALAGTSNQNEKPM